jgi:hypothetical protein
MPGVVVTIVALIFAVVGGLESAVQTGTNATLGRLTSRGFAGASPTCSSTRACTHVQPPHVPSLPSLPRPARAGIISISTSVVCVGLFFLIDTYAAGTPKPDPAAFKGRGPAAAAAHPGRLPRR